MSKILEFMGQDHDRLDKLFEEFRKQHADLPKSKLLFHDFKIGLQRHIVWEEEILFPIFENKTGMRDTGPTAVMRTEHREIKALLEKIHNNIMKGDGEIELLEAGLIEILTEHNNKEESILYPWIDSETGEQEREEIFIKMKNLPPEKYSNCCVE